MQHAIQAAVPTTRAAWVKVMREHDTLLLEERAKKLNSTFGKEIPFTCASTPSPSSNALDVEGEKDSERTVTTVAFL